MDAWLLLNERSTPADHLVGRSTRDAVLLWNIPTIGVDLRDNGSARTTQPRHAVLNQPSAPGSIWHTLQHKTLSASGRPAR